MYLTTEWQDYDSEPQLKIQDIRLKSGQEIKNAYPKDGIWNALETGAKIADCQVTQVRLSHEVYDEFLQGKKQKRASRRSAN